MALPPKPVLIGRPPSPLQEGLVSSPALTMGLVGAGIGGAVGWGMGGALGFFLGKSLAIKGAMLGAALAGARGVHEGRELGRWIKSLNDLQPRSTSRFNPGAERSLEP
jgi:hypothetical protein